MPTANWNGTVIAESETTIVVEGNHYFDPDSVAMTHLQASDHHTVCGWKGTASYYDVVVDGKVNRNAAWTYSDPKDAANNIKGRIAFWNGVVVS